VGFKQLQHAAVRAMFRYIRVYCPQFFLGWRATQRSAGECTRDRPVRCPKAELTPYAVIIPRFGVFVKGFLHFIYDFFVNIFDFEEKKKKGLVGGGGEDVRWCEQNFLTFVGLLFISLTHVKETNQRKRVQGDSKSPCRSPRFVRVLYVWA
ncbi:MAG: hypothetical protein II346_07550, partial [Ruminococcus sp.]|nr:hypothetical protein [Ruminococcus sp.]